MSQPPRKNFTLNSKQGFKEANQPDQTAYNPKTSGNETNLPVKATIKSNPAETTTQAIRTLSFEDPRDDPKIPLYGMLRFQLYLKDANIAKAHIDAQWRAINGAIEDAGGHYRWLAGRETADGKVRFCIGFELPSSSSPTPSSIISKIFTKYRRQFVVEFATRPEIELPVPGFALAKNTPIAKDGFLTSPKCKGKSMGMAKADRVKAASAATPSEKAKNLKPKMVVYYSDSEEEEGREDSEEEQEDEMDEDYQDDLVPTSDTAAPVSEDEEVVDDDEAEKVLLPSSDTVMQDGDDENDEDWEDYESESVEVEDDDEDDEDYEP